LALLGVEGGLDLGELDPLLLEQVESADAVGAVGFGVDGDVSHGAHMVRCDASLTRATTARSTAEAPACSKARAQPSAVAPVVSTSSISSTRWPATLGNSFGGTA